MVDAISADYFVLASFKGEFEPSSEANLSADDVNKMIGYFKASNTSAGDFFGHSVALSGDGHTLAIAAYFENNSASGVITDKSEVNGDKDGLTTNNSGAVYLFSNSSGKWVQTTYVKASNPGAGDNFGESVALNNDGTILAVGAVYEQNSASAVGVITDGSETSDDNGGEAFSGAVYLFNKNNDVWAQSAYIKASTPLENGTFGVSVKLSGDGTILAVGADEQSLSGTSPGPGAVYLFSNSDDVWTQTAYLKASNPGNGDRFGYSIALSDDGATLAVGAYQEDNNVTGVNTDGSEIAGDVAHTVNAGAVYLFNKSSDVWSQTAYVKASNTGSSDNFGYSVALSGDGATLAVGAYNEDYSVTGVTTNSPTVHNIDDGATERAGAVYLFNKNNDVWSQTFYVKASNTEEEDGFGYSVALSFDGARLAVGAYAEDNSVTGVITDDSEVARDVILESDAGAVYLFDKSSDVWSQTAYVKASNTEEEDGFGSSLALSGDGATLAVGAPQEDNAATGIITDGSENGVTGTGDTGTSNNAGAVYVY
ncbi:hypothetical protein BTO11_07615 [Psychrosphaera saromensis]|uniref:Integrin n=1 Tax=Psychrosphaera saromensis TaxID=716813 RepID=A0A2S7UZ40_9GAMM|nr:hypothetical protein BTO11_07615 [Psychrosphaera saromensis]